jgi:hypothetical protein
MVMGLILDLMVLPLNLYECFGTFKTELQSLFSSPSGEVSPLSGEKKPRTQRFGDKSTNDGGGDKGCMTLHTWGLIYQFFCCTATKKS